MMSTMRRVATSALFIGCATASQPEEYERAFEDFVAKYDRKYDSQDERAASFAAFKKSYEYVATENAKNLTYALEINEFADQSPEKFSGSRLGLSAPAQGKLWAGMPHLGTDVYSGKKLAASVDWFASGAVTAPKNQGKCGSCWTFSATGALEGAWKVATKELISFSEQQLVDCSKNGGNNGCHGGAMDTAFEYLQKHPVCTEESYGYLGQQQPTCGESNCTVGIPKGSVLGFKDVKTEDLEALMEAVSQQPVSVGIEADQLAFQLYRGGILTKECGTQLDHGVLIVGYGTDKGMDYWKVKNSWGPQWGESGFVRIQRGKSKAGECGIKLMASYPVVHKAIDEVVV